MEKYKMEKKMYYRHMDDGIERYIITLRLGFFFVFNIAVNRLFDEFSIFFLFSFYIFENFM